MGFYKEAGSLILGTRLRRLSEKYLQEIGLIYKRLNIDFEASWFSFFYLLQDGNAWSMTDIAASLDISHSAVSQMLSSLRKRGFVNLEEDEEDARRKRVSLSTAGMELLRDVQPVWNSMNLAMQALWEDQTQQFRFLAELDHLEEKLEQNELSAKTLAMMPAIDCKVKRLGQPPYPPAFRLFQKESEGRFLGLPEGIRLWVVLYGESVVGGLALEPCADLDAYILQQIFVRNDLRRKGLATAMIEAACTDLNLNKTKADFLIKDPQLPLIQLLIKGAFTFTISPDQKTDI